jgi:hypothetical protein
MSQKLGVTNGGMLNENSDFLCFAKNENIQNQPDSALVSDCRKSQNVLFWIRIKVNAYPHRLNMEFDLQSLFRLHVHSSGILLCKTPLPPRPPHLVSMVSQDRQHLFVTPWLI